jgi:hypothetical protein
MINEIPYHYSDSDSDTWLGLNRVIPFCPQCKSNRSVYPYTYISPNHYQCAFCKTVFVSAPKETKEMYIIVRDPSEVKNEYSEQNFVSRREIYSSYEQAVTVAKKLAQKNRVNYFVAKLIAKTKLVNVEIETL